MSYLGAGRFGNRVLRRCVRDQHGDVGVMEHVLAHAADKAGHPAKAAGAEQGRVNLRLRGMLRAVDRDQ